MEKTNIKMVRVHPAIQETQTILNHFVLVSGMSFLLLCFIAVTWGVFNPERVGSSVEADSVQTIEDTTPEPIAPALEASVASVEPGISSNSVYNWQYAVDQWNECKGNVNMATFYQDWVNWYGELSAMQMCLITWPESRYDWYAKGDNGWSIGMFQINIPAGHCKKVEGLVGGSLSDAECKELLFDPEINLTVARQLYEAQGWTPWSGRKAYLPDFRVDWLTLE